jgi:FMN phosphatase YigB (HAD superfamily)
MQSFDSFLYESKSKDLGGLTIFDIDDTLFHTTAQIAVMKDGKKIKDLTNQEYNTYKLKQGESYDYSQFRDSK